MFPLLNLEMQSRIVQTEAPRFSPCRNGQITPTDRLARSRFRRVVHSPRFLMLARMSRCPAKGSPVPSPILSSTLPWQDPETSFLPRRRPRQHLETE